MEAGKEQKSRYGRPVSTSHLPDLSGETLEGNSSLSKQHFEEISGLEMGPDSELGIPGGEEDGVDNTDADNARLYTQPTEVYEAFRALSEVGSLFTVAASFGNVHGVYSPGNVVLRPEILRNSQAY